MTAPKIPLRSAEEVAREMVVDAGWLQLGTDGVRLASDVSVPHARGVHVLASNSDTPRARELYAGFEIRTLTRANSVNSKASARGGKAEILVLGGTWTPKGA